MAKTIELTPKASKWIFILTGTINSILGISQLLQAGSTSNWGLILGIILLLAGILTVTYGIILFNPKNKLTPKVQVDENGILIKEDIKKKQIRIDWGNVKEITYKSFELTFLLNNDVTESVILETPGEISIEVKKTIRQFANDRQIKIIGG